MRILLFEAPWPGNIRTCTFSDFRDPLPDDECLWADPDGHCPQGRLLHRQTTPAPAGHLLYQGTAGTHLHSISISAGDAGQQTVQLAVFSKATALERWPPLGSQRCWPGLSYSQPHQDKQTRIQQDVPVVSLKLFLLLSVD